jgi:FeS assembly protein IscX
MPKDLTWDDADDLGLLLSKHPETDPLAVRFTDLHRLVTELPVQGRSQKSNEASWKRSDGMASEFSRPHAGHRSQPRRLAPCPSTILFPDFLQHH